MKTRKELRRIALTRASMLVLGLVSQAIIRYAVLAMSGDVVIANLSVMLTLFLHVGFQTVGVASVQEYIAAPDPKPEMRAGMWRDQ